MKAKMSVMVRIKLSEMVGPMDGSYARLKMVRDLQNELSLSEKEQKTIGYSEVALPQGGVGSRWAHPKKDPMKEITIGEILTEKICAELRKLEETEKLTQDKYELFEAFKPEIDRLAAAATPTA